MIPRGRLDVGWTDLAAGAAWCFAPGSRAALERKVEQLWSPGGDALVALSVRSGLDLLLSALDYPRGSEVLVSAVTIRDMVRIVEHHGLVPVPVDLDMDACALRVSALERAASPRTKAILAAHLFGSRMPLDDVGAFASARGLLLIEDVAQSFTGLEYRGHPASDVSLFSFGPIKTGSALGGATLRVRDAALRERMRALQSGYPVQGRRAFLERALRFLAVRLAMTRVPFTAICLACRAAGRRHDDLINHSVRGFSGSDLFANIRRQPSVPLLALLRRRLTRSDGRRVRRRLELARQMARLAGEFPRPGRRAAFHSYWTFPVLCDDPDGLVRHLATRGFDATRGSWSLYPVPPVEGRPGIGAPEAHETMRRIVYLPVYAGVSEREIERLAAALTEFERGRAGVSARRAREAAPTLLQPGGR